ncbi:GNAT family N-acetyltransferase [Conexibacter stalactiti]|uniref:GNAT family N-acetyltransferase n=1 Tax=Conexibacter stalactiti TaxID=1940611 RepID=A0ABU4HX07_9ACTN|nr:GNAT family N-acetyltransferase [Conexibacter stalactiti]MDW5597856.1 GNAT family N-acetyltransferase [Conexibacter stalactiti]MEC5038498.1 GNAT family N-acetyltransferase [Conexibacter stalactiti]
MSGIGERRVGRAPLGARPAVRRATEADLPALARTLASAFHDDPIARWACASERVRPSVLERFYAIRLRQVLRHDEIWVEDGVLGGALWLPPELWRTSAREDVRLARSLVHPRLLPRLPLVMYGFTGIERRHPETPPHWYLAVLGTDPAAQGRGIGSALLAPVLERCDEDGIGAYLESSKEENVAFYARHGFRVTEVVTLPRGPRAWLMWREPR